MFIVANIPNLALTDNRMNGRCEACSPAKHVSVDH